MDKWPPNHYIITENGSLKLVGKCSLKMCWFGCTAVKKKKKSIHFIRAIIIWKAEVPLCYLLHKRKGFWASFLLSNWTVMTWNRLQVWQKSCNIPNLYLIFETMCPLNWKLKQYHNMRSAGVRPEGKRASWDAQSEPPPLHAVPISPPLTIHATNSPLSSLTPLSHHSLQPEP